MRNSDGVLAYCHVRSAVAGVSPRLLAFSENHALTYICCVVVCARRKGQQKKEAYTYV